MTWSNSSHLWGHGHFVEIRQSFGGTVGEIKENSAESKVMWILKYIHICMYKKPYRERERERETEEESYGEIHDLCLELCKDLPTEFLLRPLCWATSQQNHQKDRSQSTGKDQRRRLKLRVWWSVCVCVCVSFYWRYIWLGLHKHRDERDCVVFLYTYMHSCIVHTCMHIFMDIHVKNTFMDVYDILI